MIWENDTENCIISYMKRIASPGSMHDTGCLGLVHWDYEMSDIGKSMEQKQWKQCQTFFFLGSKITADTDCSHLKS